MERNKQAKPNIYFYLENFSKRGFPMFLKNSSNVENKPIYAVECKERKSETNATYKS